MAAGDLDDPMPIVLCGFTGYQDFAPELAASNLQRSWAKGSGRVTPVRIALPGFNPDRLFTSIDIARRFEEPTFVTQVGERIQAAIPAGPVRIGLPAVLGLTRTHDIHAALMAVAGHPVFEIPTLPPSVPALRLFDRLRKQLQESGTELISAAPAHAAELQNRRCTRIFLKAAGREQPVEARAFVLALEDWVDGAFRAGVHQVREPFFGNLIAEHPKPAERTAQSLFSPQPYAQLGYRVTDRLQPADGAGTPLADNVFIAGGAIAGYDPSGTKSRGGMAVATAYRAAQEALAA
jgi:glycerol-3-phosphate dehydrogenase subunit B